MPPNPTGNLQAGTAWPSFTTSDVQPTVTLTTAGINWQDALGSPKPRKSRSSKNREKFYNVPIKDLLAYQLRNKLTNGEIGLEIECEGSNLFNSPIQYWKCTQDHSLRAAPDGSPPVEYVLQKPLSRQDVSKALGYLAAKLKQAKSALDLSSRTSVHVHVNMQEHTFKEVVQFLCLYYIFEEMLVSFSGPDREGNFFCLRGKDSEHQLIQLENAVREGTVEGLFNDNYRYCSCNYISLGKFGSLEFRSLRGTVDQKLIEVWIDLLLHIKQKALEFNSPREIAEQFIASPQNFFTNIWSSRKDLADIFTGYGDLLSKMWSGVRLMRDLAFCTKWEERIVQEEKPKLEGTPIVPGLWVSEVVPGVWLRQDDDDEEKFWLENYNFNTLECQFVGRSFELGIRRRYSVNPETGSYRHLWDDIGENEICPT